jgi:hypothetical protein
VTFFEVRALLCAGGGSDLEGEPKVNQGKQGKKVTMKALMPVETHEIHLQAAQPSGEPVVRDEAPGTQLETQEEATEDSAQESTEEIRPFTDRILMLLASKYPLR